MTHVSCHQREPDRKANSRGSANMLRIRAERQKSSPASASRKSVPKSGHAKLASLCCHSYGIPNKPEKRAQKRARFWGPKMATFFALKLDTRMPRKTVTRNCAGHAPPQNAQGPLCPQRCAVLLLNKLARLPAPALAEASCSLWFRCGPHAQWLVACVLLTNHVNNT